VGVDSAGRADPDEVAAAITPDTAVVHLQVVNHEIATFSEVATAVESVRRVAGRDVLVHVDAASAVGHVPVDIAAWGVDLMSLSAHKFGGPPGVGALFVRRGVRLEPLLVGGDQERARRAGLENSLAIAGLGAAAAEVIERGASEAEQARRLTDRVAAWAADREGVSVLGDPVVRAPHILCLAFERVEPQPVLIGLDNAGVAVHSGSSCSSEAFEPSPVLAAIGADADRSMRVSVGWSSTDEDIDRLIAALGRVLDEVEALAGP
jgi:cysteine desulfurase